MEDICWTGPAVLGHVRIRWLRAHHSNDQQYGNRYYRQQELAGNYFQPKRDRLSRNSLGLSIQRLHGHAVTHRLWKSCPRNSVNRGRMCQECFDRLSDLQVSDSSTSDSAQWNI